MILFVLFRLLKVLVIVRKYINKNIYNIVRFLLLEFYFDIVNNYRNKFISMWLIF